ncbi:MAG: hypothetical protein ACFFAJ_01765 [Candidatus Hodarchaeota archaeon]
MSQRSKQIGLYLILCIILSLNLAIVAGRANQTEENPIIVLFDEAHGQFFDHSLYSKALSDLEQNGMEIIINNVAINRTLLEGVDIFVSTNPNSSFSIEEQHYISEYLKKGNSMFLLANPLNEENESLDGHGYIFNAIMSTAAPNIGLPESVIKFWVNAEDTGTPKATDVVMNDFSDTGMASYLLINVNSSDHEILSLDQNITSVITHTCSIKDAKEDLILASSEAYAKTTRNTIHSYSSDLTLIGSAGPIDNGARILLCGSSIMFSDLNDTLLQSSWYESENNSLLWNNIFTWLANISPTDLPPTFSLSETSLVLFSMIIVATILLFVGSVFYSMGSGKKVEILKTSEPIVVEPKRKAPKPSKTEKPALTQPEAPTRQTKRERRLQQIKKDTKKRGKSRR